MDQPVRKILRDVASPDKKGLPVALVRAALQAAGDLPAPLPAGEELENFCNKLWYPREEATLVMAARLLGHLPPDANGQYPKSRIKLLDAKAYAVWPGEIGEDGMPQEVYAPHASAAAAVALWEMHAADADRAVKDAVDLSDSDRLAARYVAWHLARLDPKRALDLALTMLPDPEGPPGKAEDRERVHICGALTLALSARTPEQRQQAIGRIRARLEVEQQNYYVSAACKSALLMLGCEQFHQFVVNLLDLDDYPLRESVLAVTMAHDRQALGGLLWNIPDDKLKEYLINQSVLDVLNSVHDLPRIDPAAYGDLLTWQIRIVRAAYGVRRSQKLSLDE